MRDVAESSRYNQRGIRKVLSFGTAAIALLLLCASAYGQLNYGRIFGGITDRSGAVVVGAKVTVIDVDRAISRPLTSDSAGAYSAPSLLPGTYTVRAEAPGFQTAERTEIVVGVGQDVRVDLTLRPGEQTQTVTVSAQAPEINTTGATLGGEIETHEMNEVPIQGRVFNRLLEYTPGIQATAGQGAPAFSSQGNRGDAQVWMIDGVPDLDLFSASGPLVGTTSLLDDLVILPLDAIQETEIIANPNAQYGWKSGAQVNTGLKSGTNQIHGTAYAYGRDSAMDANNPFTGVIGKAADEFEQYGGSLGGPIQKNKLFYFGNFEGVNFTVGSPQTYQIPSSVSGAGTSGSFPDAIAAMNALHEPLNPLSLNLAGCTAAGVCNPAAGVFNNASAASTVPLNLNNVGYSYNAIGKIDYHLNEHNSLNADYFFGQAANDAAQGIHRYWDQANNDREQLIRGVWVWYPNSSWVNEARFGYSRGRNLEYPAECTQSLGQPNYTAEFGLVSGAGLYPPDCGFPGVNINTFTGIGPAAGTSVGSAGQIWTTGTYSAIDNISYTRGKHQFKFGAEANLSRYSGRSQPVNSLGNINFGTGGISAFAGATALETFLAGSPSSGTVLIGNEERNINQNEYAAFFQDEYRLTRQITIDAGVRYEYQTPITERNNLLGNFDPSAPLGLIQQTSGNPVYSVSNHDFSPRLALAWDVNGKGTTVVRAGGSLIYNLSLPYTVLIAPDGGNTALMPTGFTFYRANGQAVPGPGTIEQGSATLSPQELPWAVNTPIFNVGPSALQCGNGLGQVNPNAATGATNPANPAPCALLAVAPYLKTAYVSEWTLGIQHAFTNSLSATVSYVGNHGTHEGAMIDVNQPTPGAANGKTAPTNEAELLRRPYYSQFPYFGQIRTYEPVLSSNYDALEATLNERLYHGLYLAVNYTYARALDEFSQENNAFIMDSVDPHLDYGNSNSISPHHVSIIATYAIPALKAPGQLLQGWQVNSTVNLDSALPFNAADTTSDISGTGELEDRWSLIGPASAFRAGGPIPLPCYGTTGSSFAKVANCAKTLPAACIAAATAEPNGPGGTTGVASLNSLGCYMEGSSVIVPPAQGTFGAMGRDVLVNHQDLRDWDFSVTKDTKIKERMTVQFRAEFFNVLNHTLYAAPSSNPDSPSTFGQSQSTPNEPRNPVFGVDGPRQIQLGARLIF